MSYNEQLQQARFGLSQTNNHAVAPLPSPSIVTGARMGNHFSIYFLIIFSIPPPRVRPESNLIYWPLQKTQFRAHAQTFHCIFFFFLVFFLRGSSSLGVDKPTFWACTNCCHLFSIAGDEEDDLRRQRKQSSFFIFLLLLYPGNSSVLPPARLSTGSALIIIPTKSRCESTHLSKGSSVNCIRCSSASSFPT